MKILYLITRSDQIGGAHIHVRDLALYGMSQGHEVYVCIGGNGFFCQQLINCGIKTIKIDSLQRPLNLFRDLKSIIAFWSILKKLKPDIVSLHSAKAGIVGRSLSSFFPYTSFFFTAHGWSFTDGVSPFARLLYQFIETIFSRMCKKVICVCEADYLLAKRLRVAPLSKLICIHNGMPDWTLDNLDHNYSHDTVNILCVARFEQQKDHSSLLCALSSLKDISWHLTLVGDGALRSRIQDQVVHLRLEDRVSFLGILSNVVSVYQASDIFVLPSHWEGFPRSILEAMRSSLPVIATDVGGVRESVVDSHNGFLINRSDVRMWREKLYILLCDRKKREDYGANSRAMFLSKYTFSEMARKTFSLYSVSCQLK